MSDFIIKPATRQGVKPLVGFYGKSGSGKTLSALFFARGLVGPSGRITLIDSESGRGSLFADMVPGGYSVLDLEPPFSPERYALAFEKAEQSSDCIVVDSMSHEWAGEGGVLDMQEDELHRMAGDNWQKREQCKMAAWIKPKGDHKRMVGRVLRSRVALICCLRGEEKTHMIPDGAKKKVITDEFSSPLFDPRFIFELLLNFETVAHNGVGGFVIPRKITHPLIGRLLPKENEQIGIQHGEALAKWCANPGTVSAGSLPAHPAGGGSPITSSAAGAQLPLDAPPAKSKAEKPAHATDKTRNWMLEELLKIHTEEILMAYAIDKALILPAEESLCDWPLSKVPTTRFGLAEISGDIDAWRGK